MDSDRIYLVIILTVVIVIGVNSILYLALRRGNEANLINLTRKALHTARNPWQEEDQSLQELARLVADLKTSQNTIPPDSPSDKGLDQTEQKDAHA